MRRGGERGGSQWVDTAGQIGLTRIWVALQDMHGMLFDEHRQPADTSGLPMLLSARAYSAWARTWGGVSDPHPCSPSLGPLCNSPKEVLGRPPEAAGPVPPLPCRRAPAGFHRRSALRTAGRYT